MSRVPPHQGGLFQVHQWDALPLDRITEMVTRKVVAGAEATLTQTYLKRGALVPLHAHPHEAMIYVLQGALRVRVRDGDVTVREGEVLVVAPAEPHQAEALDDCFVMTFVTTR